MYGTLYFYIIRILITQLERVKNWVLLVFDPLPKISITLSLNTSMALKLHIWSFPPSRQEGWELQISGGMVFQGRQKRTSGRRATKLSQGHRGGCGDWSQILWMFKLRTEGSTTASLASLWFEGHLNGIYSPCGGPPKRFPSNWVGE